MGKKGWTEIRNALVLFICSLLLMEGLLQLLSVSSPQVSRLLAGPWRDAEFFPDKNFRYRGNPLYEGHDSAGYRNLNRPVQAEVVTFGDSNTYGVLVESDEVWPRVLEAEIHRRVYNMGMDGYGPGEYFLQLDEALALRPNDLIIALYFGNDLLDAFAFSMRHPHIVGEIDPEKKSAAELLEKEHPIEFEFNRAFGVENKKDQNETMTDTPLRLWISKNVKLYGLMRAFKYGFKSSQQTKMLTKGYREAADSLSPIQKEYFSLYEGPRWRAILGSGYRSLLLDARDPRVQMGLEITQRMLNNIAIRCGTAGVRLHVVLLPTKDNVFWPQVPDPDNYRFLRKQVMDEASLKNAFISALNGQGVDFIDVLLPLRNAAVQPYFENADGHPNAAGHQIIARTIASHLSDRTRVESKPEE